MPHLAHQLPSTWSTSSDSSSSFPCPGPVHCAVPPGPHDADAPAETGCADSPTQSRYAMVRLDMALSWALAGMLSAHVPAVGGNTPHAPAGGAAPPSGPVAAQVFRCETPQGRLYQGRPCAAGEGTLLRPAPDAHQQPLHATAPGEVHAGADRPDASRHRRPVRATPPAADAPALARPWTAAEVKHWELQQQREEQQAVRLVSGWRPPRRGPQTPQAQGLHVVESQAWQPRPPAGSPSASRTGPRSRASGQPSSR